MCMIEVAILQFIILHYAKCCKMVTSLINCNASIDDDMLQEEQGSN
jgi:hypothetical protein